MRRYPLRIEQKVSCSDVESFIRYVNQYKCEEKTKGLAIFAEITATGGVFRAYLDYHLGVDEAGWCKHTVYYMCPATVEWSRWNQNNRRLMTQGQFAEFLEETQLDVREPDGATLLEIIKTMQAKTDVWFSSAIRLENGNVQLRYDESTEARAGAKGQFEVPTRFKLGLVLFEGGLLYGIEARLKYQLVDRAVKFRYELVNPHIVVEDAIKSMLEAVAKETGVKPFRGRTID
jgi:uncharacterized protein YfdQ (DUF2303 family)